MTMMLLAAALALQPAPADRLADADLGEVMRFAALSEPRLREARCAALMRFKARNGEFPRERADAFTAAVGRAVATDTGLAPDLVEAFLDQYETELVARQSGAAATDAAAALAAAEAECADHLAASAPTLAPTAERSLVDPALTTCHALYRLAAERAPTAERAALAARADRAEALALAGLTGAERARASALLAEALQAHRADAEATGGDSRAQDQRAERDLMRLVSCLPLMAQAEQ